MKKFILSLVLTATMFGAIAQTTSLVATLSHNGNVQVFYQNTALQQALRNAQSGDTICLSSGLFLGDTIRHNVTILGIGYSQTVTLGTWVNGNIYIQIPSNDTVGRLRLDGIGFRNIIYQDSVLHNPYITRCNFVEWRINNSYAYFNGVFVNCKLQSYNSTAIDHGANTLFQNCYIHNMVNTSNSTDEFRNCVIGYRSADRFGYYSSGYYRYSYYYRLCSSTMINCVLVDFEPYNGGVITLHSTATAVNCVYYSVLSNAPISTYFNSCNGIGNRGLSASASLFETYRGSSTYNEAETFELTESARTTYLGIDSTQIGLYGGAAPFSTEPSYPHITRLVSNHVVNAEGKLEVQVIIGDEE